MTGGPLPLPVLWLTGPAGVGKSTVSWQLFTELAAAGQRVAFADTDQLCMCYPAPAGDPGRERLKALNVGAILPHYRAPGAQCVVLNGVLDPVAGVRHELIPQAEVTVCRLRAGRDELVRRLTGRRGPGDDLEATIRETLSEADAMDAAAFADVCVDTSAVPSGAVAGLVRDACHDWPGFREPAGDTGGTGEDASGRRDERRGGGGAAGGVSGHVLLICGPAGVGKSTIGFEVYMRALAAGLCAGYLDLGQTGFVRPDPPADPGRRQLTARNLAAVWRNYHAAGARHLVATAPAGTAADVQTFADALPAATVTVCRLCAGRAELTRRILSRGTGGSWPEPGDPLRGQPPEHLAMVAERAAAHDAALGTGGPGMISIDTDGCRVADAATLVATAAGWPGLR